MSWKFSKWWHLLPGTITAGTIALLFKLSALQPFEHIAYSVLFELRGELPLDERIVIIAIDDASLRQLGRFPWARRRYVQLFNQLAQAEPSVVAIDLLWSETSWDDKSLAEVINRQGRVVLAQAWDATGLPLTPVASLKDAAIGTGHIIKREDSDGIVRKIDPQIQDQLALSFATIQAYSLVQAPVSLPSLDRPLWVNWLGQVGQNQQYSFVDVVQGKISSENFRDKIVLVGVTATGIDPMISPLDRNTPASSVYLHATAIHNLLKQNNLQPLGQGWFFLILLLGGPGLSSIMTNWGTRQQFIVITGLCFIWGTVSVVLLKANFLLPVATPIVLFILTGVAVALNERLRENALLQQKIQQLWQTYHQDIVIRRQDPHLTPHTQKRGLLQPTVSLISRVAQLSALAEQFGRSQSTQAAIAHSLSLGIAAVDRDGTVWFCNSAATEWLQIQVGSDLAAQLVPQWLSPEEWQANLETLQGGHSTPAKEFHCQEHWLELKLEPLMYRVGQTAAPPTEQWDGFLLVLEDISARKQVEENLNRQVEELNQLSLLKDDFLSTVSHELRAPMANIKMATYMLRIASSPEQREHYLQILQDECSRETDLINDLLDLQRLESGVKAIQSEEFYLQDFLPPIVEPFYARAANRQQNLKLSLSPDLPAITSDQASLERLVTELINNACKYTPPHHHISVNARFASPYIELQVINSGVEIPAAELSKIFDKFYRIPSSDRWKQGGTGLGLALVKRLTEHLGGKIQVESNAQQTSFTIYLPSSSPDVV
jgi:signal transduction histidine kinase